MLIGRNLNHKQLQQELEQCQEFELMELSSDYTRH
ncbi:hypothetical protein IFO70_39660 [Phormidium tenue FACHB-886]|nr:hypothetical protein [Phormidium tenue FACHB-886]